MDLQRASVTLDRSHEPWVGSFAGLGRVAVHKDGTVDVSLEAVSHDAPESVEMRDRALRHGWGEPLSLLRRGYGCIGGSAVASPDPSVGCLLMVGDPHDVPIVMFELARIGWPVLSDRLVPTRWRGERLIAFPRDSPVLLSSRRARRSGLTASPVRARTDAVAVECLRCQDPLPVAGVAIVSVRRPDESTVERVQGRQRFECAGRLMLGGVFATEGPSNGGEPAGPESVMAEHLRLAHLPYLRLRFRDNTLADDVGEFLALWHSTVARENGRG